ncbi:MAG TPA: DUF5053 domain-containing protein [Candidatus Bacteroides pullicola]|uniref:DUF5053 domain-containing protein n=1 Tax=Candidatus Bacteroides pullicola TaxID=2838475 RepID=A0A9D1ZHH2_9BACE|nr:DUF5053 domain-containing protein [Candidatus Bacteroides pullicola]
MDKVKHFFELKQQWVKSTEEERAHIDEEINALLESMSDDEHQQMDQAVIEDLRSLRQGAEALGRTFKARDLMKPVLPFISVSALAKEYFGKSSSWFYQRLNGNVVHGKQVAFTEEELTTLAKALRDMAAKLERAAAAVA